MKIANNILSSDDPKFRTIKATNGMLQKKVLSVKGGHDYIIAVSNGFFLLENCKLPALRRWLYVILSQSTCDYLIKGSLATAAYAIYSFGD